jgi:hypothetical protein
MNLSTQQWINLIVIALIVGFSALSWLARKLQEQAARKRALEEIERRRAELLRTGKDPGVVVEPVLSAQEARLQEIAARRQAQLQELRRRAQMRQQQGGSVTARVPGLPPRASTPVPVPMPRPAPSPRPVPIARPPAPAPPRTPSRGPVEPARRPRSAPPAAVPRPARPAAIRPAPRPEVIGESHAERLVPDVPLEPPRPKAGHRRWSPRSAAEWRRAVVLAEILGPPVGRKGIWAGPEAAQAPGL